MSALGFIECSSEFQEYRDRRIFGLLQVELVHPVQYPGVAQVQVVDTLPAVVRPAMRFIVNPRPAEEATGNVELVEYIFGPIRDQRKVFAVAFSVTVAACIQNNQAILGATTHRWMTGRARWGRSLVHQCGIVFALDELRPLIGMALPARFRLFLIMNGAVFVAHRQNSDVRFLRRFSARIPPVTIITSDASLLVRRYQELLVVLMKFRVLGIEIRLLVAADAAILGGVGTR